MNKILFIKTNELDIKVNDYIIGNLTRKCKVGKIVDIYYNDITIEVYDKYDGIS